MRLSLDKLKLKIMEFIEKRANKYAEKSVQQCCLLYSYEPPTPNILLTKDM